MSVFRRPIRCGGLRNWYGDGTDGDIHITADTELASVQDGDMVVVNAESLTIDAGCTLTTANRCRGLIIYCRGDAVINGTLSMTARGCHANPAESTTTTDTPVAPSDGHAVPSEGLIIRRLAEGQTDTHTADTLGYGCGQAAVDGEAHQPVVDGDGVVIAIPRVGGPGGVGGNSQATGDDLTGGTATNGSGGGGAGSMSFGTHTGEDGTAGTCWSGGTGSGARSNTGTYVAPEPYGGSGGDGEIIGASGGGAGNPGGTGHNSGDGEDGTGGLLVLIVRGNITFGPSASLESAGSDGGGSTTGDGGGGSGGGVIVVLCGGIVIGMLAFDVSGGAGGTGNNATYDLGGAGGDGSVIGPIQIDQ